MKNVFVKLVGLSLVGVVGLMGCAQKEEPKETSREIQKENTVVENVSEIKNEDTTKSQIVINEIENLASAKIMADSKVIEREDLPEDMQELTELVMPDGVTLSMISEIYTKSDMTKEEFDVLHDYNFLFSDDESKNVMIHASKIDTPLRDYFFQASNDVSLINGNDVTISKYEDKYIARFSFNEINYDIQTDGLSQDELVDVLNEIVK